MLFRGRRFVIGLGLAFLAGMVLLALLECGRRRQVEAAGLARLDGSGTAVPAAELEERYRLVGVEEIDGRRTLRVHFEPAEPVERSFRGAAWIDVATGEPVRLVGSPVKPRLRVDRFEMLFDYGPSENGFTQLRRVVIETAGGFALISWHLRSETELSDYRAAD